MTRSKLEVSNLYKVFGEKPEDAIARSRAGASREEIMRETGSVVALRDINFGVNEGEIFVIMGLSGSGKSTLLRCINRLEEASAGSIRASGRDVRALDKTALREFRRKTFGMVFQHFGLFPHRTVLENVTFGLEIQGLERGECAARGEKALETVGLTGWADRATGSLSGGMQQRVGLARALAVDPEILLMDEPFSALDPLIRTKLQNELLRLHSALRKTVLFVTHDLNEAIKLGHRIAIVNAEGAIAQVGTPREILLYPADEYIKEFVGDIKEAAKVMDYATR